MQLTVRVIILEGGDGVRAKENPAGAGPVRMNVMNADAREWRCRYLCQTCGLNP